MLWLVFLYASPYLKEWNLECLEYSILPFFPKLSVIISYTWDVYDIWAGPTWMGQSLKIILAEQC